MTPVTKPPDPAPASSEVDVPESLLDYATEFVLGRVIRIGEAVGVSGMLRFGAAFGRVWRTLGLPRTRRVREQLLSAFPERSESERAQWERQVFEHLGQGVAELILLSGRHRKTLVDLLEVDGLEHLERAQRDANGKGAIVIAPHLGNWELAAAKLEALGVPVAAVYRGSRRPALDRALRRARAGKSPLEGAHAIQQIRMGSRAGVHFVRALAEGRNVLVLLDQRAHRNEGILISFFGRPAQTRTGPIKLADRAGAPVLCAFARREPDGRHHRLTFHPALQLEPGASDDEKVLRQNVQQVTAVLEQAIRALPGQWIWTHRRWRVSSDEVEAD